MGDIKTGQDLFQMAQNRLGGYGNAVPTDKLLDFLNEGKNEVWAHLKSTLEDYFIATTQSTDETADNYFPKLTPGVREYSLPSNFREIRNIECVTSGYEFTEFTYRKITDPDFREARMSANSDSAGDVNTSNFMYAIIGNNTLRLAEKPAVALDLRIDYIQWVPDFEADGTEIPLMLTPYVNEISNYAVKKAMAQLQDDGSFAMWVQEWRAAVLRIAESAAPRNQSDPVFVQDFLG